MSYKISKELFEVVMGIEICKIEVTGVKINYEKEGQCQEDDEIKFLFMSFTININDFFFKCKEWIWDNGYALKSENIGKNDFYIGLINHNNEEIEYQKDFYEYSEQQAVFDACQWILDSKDKQ